MQGPAERAAAAEKVRLEQSAATAAARREQMAAAAEARMRALSLASQQQQLWCWPTPLQHIPRWPICMFSVASRLLWMPRCVRCTVRSHCSRALVMHVRSPAALRR